MLEVGPKTIAELVADRDAIVVGEFGAVLGEGFIAYPTPPEAATVAAEGESVPSFLGAVTYYEVTPCEVMLTGGHVQLGQPFVMRVSGHTSEIPEGWETKGGEPKPGRRYLLLLNRNLESPPITYSARGGVGACLLVDGPAVTFANEEPVAYAQGMTGSEFLAAVRAAVLEHHGPSTTSKLRRGPTQTTTTEPTDVLPAGAAATQLIADH